MRGQSIWNDAAEFIEAFLVALIVLVLTPLWLPVRLVKRYLKYRGEQV